MLHLLRSIAGQGTYVESDFTQRLDAQLFPLLNGDPYSGPGGYTNQSIRQAWTARVREGKPWNEAGGNADTSEAAERVCILAARFAMDPGATAQFALDNCRLTQTDSLVEQHTVAVACVLALLIQGQAFDESLSGKLMALVSSGEVPFVAKSSIASSQFSSSTLGFPSPDALLLPSWIARAAHDPDTRVDPAWKVSLVYGMSCAVNLVLPGAYYLAAAYPSDFESAVLHAVNGGGQNMSRACLAGALVGAQVGLSGIPARFIDGLVDGEEIVSLARSVATTNLK